MPPPSPMFFGIRACPMGMLLLVLSLYILYIMSLESWHTALSDHLPPPIHPLPLYCRPFLGTCPILLHSPSSPTYNIVSWMSLDSVPPHSNPLSPSYFAFLTPWTIVYHSYPPICLPLCTYSKE